MLMLAEDVAGVIAVGGAFAVAIVAIIFGAAKSMVRTKAREQTRREIAAYVAEGSISPDDAAKLLEAGDDGDDEDGKCRSKRGPTVVVGAHVARGAKQAGA